MPLHLIKLCVGAETVSDLAVWQSQCLKEMRRNREKPELIHVTRHAPKRAAELLEDGSLYWVIKGWITVRQKLRAIRPVEKDGITHCALVLTKELVAVELRPCRAFQGWRYLDQKDAPPDRARWAKDDDLPDALRRELISLGLL
jgi:hypothetical protein